MKASADLANKIWWLNFWILMFTMDPTWTGDSEQLAIPRWLGGVGGQLGVKVVIVEKLFKVDEQSSRVRRIGVRSTAGGKSERLDGRHRLAKRWDGAPLTTAEGGP
jgi:hypothetical protein